MIVRPYHPYDAEATLRLFERAIRVTARSCYSEEQTAAWLGDPRDVQKWNNERLASSTFVAETGDASNPTIAGFTDPSDTGYIDTLFVDPDHSRRGVARALLATVLDEAAARGLGTLSTHASLVAEPVFTRAGFTVTQREVVPAALSNSPLDHPRRGCVRP